MLVLDKGSKRIKNKFWNFLFVRKQNVWVSQFQVNKVNGCQRKSNEQNGSKNGKPEFNAEKKKREKLFALTYRKIIQVIYLINTIS